jgi:hypothetical protein
MGEPFRSAKKLDLASRLSDQVISTHQTAHAKAVSIGHSGKVDGQRSSPTVKQVLYLVTENLDRKLSDEGPGQVDNGNPLHYPVGDAKVRNRH